MLETAPRRSKSSGLALLLGIAVVSIAGGAGVAIWAVRRQRRLLDGSVPPPLGQSSTVAGASPKPAPAGVVFSFQQPEIISALWRSVRDGDSEELSRLKAELAALSPELQAYLLCASYEVRDAYTLDLKFRQEFAHAFDQFNKEFIENQNKADSLLATVGGLAAVAAPVLAVFIALAIAIKRAILSNMPPENRKVAENEHIFTEWEGSDCMLGLRIDGNPNPSVAQLRAAIEGDLVASRLPPVPYSYQFAFAPTIQGFQALAQKAGLYSEDYLRAAYGFSRVWNLAPGEDFPKTAIQISQYALGYTLGANRSAYPNRTEWGAIGYNDAGAGRASRVSAELIQWAETWLARNQPPEPQPVIAPTDSPKLASPREAQDYIDGYEEGRTNPMIGPQNRAPPYWNAGLLDGQAGKPARFTTTGAQP